MADYYINAAEMNRIFELLNDVLKCRITFFDLQSDEVELSNIPERSKFCTHWRKNEDFNSLCEECDRKNLEICKAKGDVHVYYCHAGLLEAMVPLYTRNQIYLGAIVFGQFRDPAKELPAEYKHFSSELQQSSISDMLKTGALLKYLSEYICENEIIKRCSRPWNELLTDFVESHLSQSITLQDAARAVNRSKSFLAHNMQQEFGMTLKQYIRSRRMQKAAGMLAAGKLVRECAFALGYKDEFYFSRDFKKHFNCAPKSMKKHL